MALALLWQHRTIRVAPVKGQEFKVPADDLPEPAATPRPRPRVADAAAEIPVPSRELARIELRIDGDVGGGLFAVLIDGRSGARLATTPLTSQKAIGATRTVTFDRAPIGIHWVHITPDPDRSRRNYLVRTKVSTAEPARCALARHDLKLQTLNLDRVPMPGICWILRRNDDPRWRYGEDAAPQRTDGEGRIAFLRLGPGTYTVAPGTYTVAPADRDLLSVDTTRPESLSIVVRLQ